MAITSSMMQIYLSNIEGGWVNLRHSTRNLINIQSLNAMVAGTIQRLARVALKAVLYQTALSRMAWIIVLNVLNFHVKKQRVFMQL
jgi:hypothetical protein